MNRGRAVVASIVLAAISTPAAAQIWIGEVVGQMMANGAAANARHNCMMGAAMVDAEVAEARGPAQATMEGYFAAVQSGSPRSAFFKLDKKTRWEMGEISLTATQIDSRTDPFKGPGRWLQLEKFVRAGQTATAHGQWRLREADGKLAGTYTGFFVRQQGSWKLQTLRLADAREYAEPIEQYCDEPGDVGSYRVNYSRAMVDQAQKALAKAERNVARYGREADATEAAAAKQKSNDLVHSEAAKARRKAAEWIERRDQAEAALTAARKDLDDIIAEAQAYQARKEAAIAELEHGG